MVTQLTLQKKLEKKIENNINIDGFSTSNKFYEFMSKKAEENIAKNKIDQILKSSNIFNQENVRKVADEMFKLTKKEKEKDSDSDSDQSDKKSISESEESSSESNSDIDREIEENLRKNSNAKKAAEMQRRDAKKYNSNRNNGVKDLNKETELLNQDEDADQFKEEDEDNENNGVLKLRGINNKRGSIFGKQIHDFTGLGHGIEESKIIFEDEDEDYGDTDKKPKKNTKERLENGEQLLGLMNGFQGFDFGTILQNFGIEDPEKDKEQRVVIEKEPQDSKRTVLYQTSRKSSDDEEEQYQTSRKEDMDEENSEFSMHNSIYELDDGGERFKDTLDEDQITMLMILKDEIFQKSVFDEGYKPMMDIVNSKFYQSLGQDQLKMFLQVNQKLMGQFI